MIAINKLLTLAGILILIYLVYKLLLRKKTGKKSNEPETTQAISGNKAIVSDDGFVEVEGTYRVCLHVSQVNMRTNTDLEKFKVWASFRAFLNEIGLPYTFLQLSQLLDVREYASWYRERMEKARLTPEIAASGLDVVKFIEGMDEDRASRDYSGYIVFHYDPDADSINSGVATGNAKLDELIGKMTGKKNLSKNERKNLARMVLSEAVHITKSYGEQMGMRVWQLNKGQVYGLAHKILQKDYAGFSSPEEASDAQCFTAFHGSVTANVIQAELVSEETEDEDAV